MTVIFVLTSHVAWTSGTGAGETKVRFTMPLAQFSRSTLLAHTILFTAVAFTVTDRGIMGRKWAYFINTIVNTPILLVLFILLIFTLSRTTIADVIIIIIIIILIIFFFFFIISNTSTIIDVDIIVFILL